MNIILANEFGGGWGHLRPLSLLARVFLQKGCQVSLLCRDYDKAVSLFPNNEINVEQSPAWVMSKVGFSCNYAQNILGNGYWDAKMLSVHFRWWCDKFYALKPDFVMTDYSPTALLAAISLNIPHGAMGIGFTVPPIATPMPSLHPWLDIDSSTLLEAEEQVLSNIKKVVPTITTISDIFLKAKRFLTIFPEIDHFGWRFSEKYLGPLFPTPSNDEIRWPLRTGYRVFMYLSAYNRCFDDLLTYLQQCDASVFGCIKNLHASKKYAVSQRIHLQETLVNLHSAATCDLAITAGNFSTSAMMLKLGIPLLICPEQLEQMLLAYRLQQQGLCEYVGIFSNTESVREKLDLVAHYKKQKQNTAVFADKYASYDTSKTINEIVQTCLQSQ